MKNRIENLIVNLYERKWKEEVQLEIYKDEKLDELMLISSGKLIEIEFLIHELKELINNKLKYNKLQQ
jgi:hypothetical protein